MKEHTFLIGLSVANYAWGIWRASKTKDYDSHHRVMRRTHLRSFVFLISAGIAFLIHYAQSAAAPKQQQVAPQTAASPQSRFKTLTNKSGVEIEAEIISFDGTNVTIRRKDGMSFTNPLSIYSKVDQEMIVRQY